MKKTIAKNFLENVMKELKYEIKDFFKQTKGDDLPTIYGEKQFHSVLFPALYHCSDIIMLEQPTQRKQRENKNSHGWIDYWVYLKKENIDFIIEVKYALHSVNSESVPKWLQGRWENSIKQIEDLPRKDTREFSLSNKPPVKIALLFLQTFENNVKNDFEKLENEYIKGHFNEISSNLNPQPNFNSVWLYPQEMLIDFDYKTKTGKKWERYYSLELFAYISK